MEYQNVLKSVIEKEPSLTKRQRVKTPIGAFGESADIFKLNAESRALGITSFFSPFSLYVSSSRNAMVTNQKGQAIAIKGAETARILHGFESQEAQYCFGARAPCNMIILDILKARLGPSGTTPLITVVYEDDDTGRVDSFDIEPYGRYHDTFGFELELTPVMKNAQPNTFIRKGTLLSHSKNIKQGIYGTGINAVCAYISSPPGIEDGFRVSKSFLEKLTPTGVGVRAADFGNDWYPLNLYGSKDHFKAFPDTGDYIRDDGLIMAFRKRDPLMDCVNMTPDALMRVDPVSDRLFYVDPTVKGRARVFNIKVLDNENEGARQSLPPTMAAQVKHYAVQWSKYYSDVLRTYRSIISERKGSNQEDMIKPRFTKRVYDALVDRPNDPDRNYGSSRSKDGRITRTYRGDLLGEFRIEIHFAYDFALDNSAKLSDMYGGKGVIVSVVPDEDMPTDEAGNRADAIIYFRSGVARLNPGQFFEHYITAHMRDVSNKIRHMVDHNVHAEEIYSYIASYYDIIQPKQAKIFRALPPEYKHEELMEIYNNGIYITILAEDLHIDETIVEKCESFLPVTKTRVRYRNESGVMVTSKKPVLLGSKYMIVLDKSDPKPMAISVSRLQHHRLPAVPNRSNKYSTPVKEQPPRAYGESENQVNGGTVGGRAIADQIDITTNPEATRAACHAISEADNPSNIDRVVDREKIPLGGGSPQRYIQNLNSCFGMKFTRDTD